ncbi:MAG: EF-hand domain-containing protein [bacterium]
MASRGVLCILGLTLLALPGIEEIQAQQVGAAPGGCQSRFARLDKDRDGRLTLEEFKAIPNLGGTPEGLFKLRDLNQDGFLSRQEYCAGKTKRKKPEAEKSP